MLKGFIRDNRDAILDRARSKVSHRQAPRATDAELKDGIPLFLEQLVTALGERRASTAEIGEHAARHGSDLLRAGFTVDQVVRDYGNICQAVTELAFELDAPIATQDFNTLNRCLDDAIAEAVSEFTRARERAVTKEGTERAAILAHEMRNQLFTAMLSFATLEEGGIGIRSSTGALLRESLRTLSTLVDRSLVEVRREVELQKREHVRIAELIEEVRIAGTLEATARGLQFAAAPVEFGIVVDADRLVLTSVFGNIVQNAFKFTRPHTLVSLTTHATADRVIIEIADQCGGLNIANPEELFGAFEQRAADRTGLGLGLAISRRGIETCGGELRLRDIPGTGCVFIVDLPRLPVTA